jgi:outer membrane receptor protein involved in Fe transport
MLKRIFYLLSLFLMMGPVVAQVTNSSISGTVKSATNEALVGATVTATHQPTGTVFRTIAQQGGIFNIVNMIPGGPYKVEVSFAGFETFNQTELFLSLGENTRIDASLNSRGNLQEVVVTGTGSVRRKTGASTSISKQQIESLPTLSRSLSDLTRITPQANGNSFGGASNRFNNITIDGAVNNDVFGLSGNGTPGGQANTTPISLDAIQEVQVVLAPYDITYGNFTGAGINAVTRSGTNKFNGEHRRKGSDSQNRGCQF